MSDRKDLVTRHNPVLTAISTDSPLSVGNGEFCFTADVTGLQTLYDTYERANFPLCTMSNWGWHSAPSEKGKTYEWEDLELTEYEHAGRKVYYPVEEMPWNKEVYHWLRHNPHKFNLGRISLCLASGKDITPDNITDIRQKLDLYTGTLYSNFTLDGEPVEVITICDSDSDTVAFKIKSPLKGLGIRISFPYGHHGTSGSDWESRFKHYTVWGNIDSLPQLDDAALPKIVNDTIAAHRKMDDTEFFVDINTKIDRPWFGVGLHECIICIDDNPWGTDSAREANNPVATEIYCSFRFSQDKKPAPSFETVQANTCKAWQQYWNKVRLADFSKTNDPRAKEIERRMVLSLYLLRIQSMGSLPPAETGLTVNSWYGRFHTEMYLWNCAFLPLWNLGEKLLPSLKWYYSIIPQAKALAKQNGYKGIRWPKQPAITGRDGPSPIAPLLVWQQPHIINMLELLYQNTYKNQDFLNQHWGMVKELAEFMTSYLCKDEATGKYEMLPPLIPAQEVHKPMEVKSPMFEMEYFRYGLSLACKWGNRLGHDTTTWRSIADNISGPIIKDGLYLAHALCPDTYATYNKDHPMMVGTYGLFQSPKVQPDTMKATLEKVIECWEQETMWGWDYAMMAMCAICVGDSELAVELLLSDSPKNQYVISGNNYQRTRADLPLYLPGNGALLLALPMLLANPPQGWSVNEL